MVSRVPEFDQVLPKDQRSALAERHGQVLSRAAVADPGSEIKLWDCVNQSWSKPIPTYETQAIMQQMGYRCSACAFVGFGQDAREVEAHILGPGGVFDKMVSHKGAHAIPSTDANGRNAFVCSACGTKMISPSRVEMHIDSIRNAFHAHRGRVTAQFIRLYSQFPSAPHILGETVITGDDE